MRRSSLLVAIALLACSVQTEGTGAEYQADASAGSGGTGVGGNLGDSGWSGGAAGTGGAAGATGGAAGSTGGAAGSTGGAAGSTGGAAGSGGGGGVEDCGNGKDDNNDGKTDCEDPLCGAFTCAPDVPKGWTGPIAFAQDATDPPACAAPYASESLAGGKLAIVAGTCPTCSCDSGSVTCSDPTVKSYDNNDCGGAELDNSTTTGCHSFNGGTKTQNSIKLQFGTTGDTCDPVTTGVPNFPAPTYATRARACGGEPEGAGCGTGKCVPNPAAPYSVCIYKKDTATCPAGYPTANVITTTFTDGRACSQCTCTKPACTATATASDYTNCGGSTYGTADKDNPCVNLSNDQIFMGVDVTAQVSCSPSTSAVSGTVDQTVFTVCCQ